MIRCAVYLTCLFLSSATLHSGEPGIQLDVPFVKQERNGCGAASIAMVIGYWQRQQGRPVNADARAIQHALYSREARGILASDLEKHLRQQGFRTFAIGGEWQDLKQHLMRGRPLIVALKAGSGDRHYVVVTGLDWERNLVLLNDPAQRKLVKQDRRRFDKDWKAAGNWALLAVPEPGSSQ